MMLDWRDDPGPGLEERWGETAAARVEGAELRALRKLLEEKAPRQEWGGLKRVLTPEGHWLWLCEHHARQYRL